MLDDKSLQDAISRLKKIEGQIRGLQKMVNEKKYCIDILNQINAATGALKKVGHNILENHIRTCVYDTMISSDKEARDKSIKELMGMLDRFIDYK